MPQIKKDKPMNQECVTSLNAIEDALYVIGGKWKLRIITGLFDGSKRFNELQRVVKGISARILSNELKDLELNGFIDRLVQQEPPVVEYKLTAYSHTLRNVVYALDEWGRNHREKLKQDSL